jgi:hypothetical protein
MKQFLLGSVGLLALVGSAYAQLSPPPGFTASSPISTSGSLTVGTPSVTTSNINGNLNVLLATSDIAIISTSKATLSNPILITAPNLNTGTNTSFHIGVAESTNQDVVLAFNYVGAASSANNFSMQMFGGTKGFAMDGAGNVSLPAVTTGTNADFLCMTAGFVVTLQTSACTISSLRFKDVLGELTSTQMVADIMALHPLVFKMKAPSTPNADPNYESAQIGLTAENVAAVDPRLSIFENDMTTPKSYRQEGILAALVVTAQTQQREIQAMAMAIVVLLLWCAGLTVAMIRRR